MSAAARNAGPGWLPTCLGGGDDYELLLAVPPGREAALLRAVSAVPVTRIGAFREEPGVVVTSGGGTLSLPSGGWSHF